MQFGTTEFECICREQFQRNHRQKVSLEAVMKIRKQYSSQSRMSELALGS